MNTTVQGSVPRLPCFFTEVELTVYLKGEFLGLAVVAVLLQVADGEFFQRKSSLHIKQQKSFIRIPKAFPVLLYLSQLLSPKC